jgi:hypothetical protein
MKLLGPDWQDRDRLGQMKSSEDRVARELLNSLGGVSFAPMVKDLLFLIRTACFGNPAGRTVD